ARRTDRRAAENLLNPRRKVVRSKVVKSKTCAVEVFDFTTFDLTTFDFSQENAMLDTLANVKTALMVVGAGDDTLLSRLMDGADAYVAQITGRDFAGGTFTETHPAGRDVLFLRNFPVTGVTSVKVDPARQFGSDTVRAADTYVLHADRGLIESL